MVTQQPVAQETCQGGSATFTARASGSAPLAYQWRRGTANVLDGGHISGAVSPALTIHSAMLADAAPDYNLVVTNSAGSITTGNVALAVYATGAGDANGDGVLDGQDVAPFVAYLLSGAAASPGYCAADMNGDGLHDGADIQAFVNTLIPP